VAKQLDGSRFKMPLSTETGLGDIVLDGDPSPPTEKDSAAPTFWPMSVVAKRSPIPATAEVLSKFFHWETEQ